MAIELWHDMPGSSPLFELDSGYPLYRSASAQKGTIKWILYSLVVLLNLNNLMDTTERATHGAATGPRNTMTESDVPSGRSVSGALPVANTLGN